MGRCARRGLEISPKECSRARVDRSPTDIRKPLRAFPETFPTLRVSSSMRLNQMRLGQLCFGGFLREFSPQTKVLRTWLKYRRLLPCNKGNTMLAFFLGRFLVACRSELAHFKTPEGGKRLPLFCWLLAGRSSLNFNP